MKASTSAPATSPLALDLCDVRRADLGLCGGKASALGELISRGFDVPPGFCLTTASYELAEQAAGLPELVAALSAAGTEHLPRAAEAIRTALEEAPVPEAVAHAAVLSYEAMDAPAVAVRSSATAEDLPTASFAGQQETVLGVVGTTALLDAVRTCWASLWSDRAVSYRAANGIDHRSVCLAVVVQRMVDADVAGVMFTANPVTGDRGEVVIEASEGLGESIVSGRVTPDRYVVGKRWGRVRERRIGQRELAIRVRSGGGTEEVVRTEVAGGPSAPVLADPVLRRLMRLGVALQRAAGAPQDVEWTWAGGRLVVLQSRPITALHDRVPATRINRMRAGINLEMLPIRPYPLDLAFLEGLEAHLWPAMFGSLGVQADLIGSALTVEDGVVLKAGPWGPRLTPRLAVTVPLAMWRSRHVDVSRWQEDDLLRRARELVRSLEARDLRTLGWQEVLATEEQAFDVMTLTGGLRGRYLPAAIRDVARLFLLLTLAGRREDLVTLLSGVETKTLRVNRALEALAAQVRSTSALAVLFEKEWAGTDGRALLATLERAAEAPEAPEGQKFLESFRAMVDELGHRENVLLLASQPTWKDAPEIPLGLVRALVAEPPEAPPPGPAPWEAARDRLLATTVLGSGPLRRRFLHALDKAREFPRLREDTHYDIALGHPVVRRAWFELGRRLAAAGALDESEDVLHLLREELAVAGDIPDAVGADDAGDVGDRSDLRTRVARRKHRRAALGDRLPPVQLAVPATLAPADALISGVPASPGVAEGPVRIVSGPSAFGALEAGDVLVAPFTNPSWTPLFQRAAAVVVEAGSAVSHAAIVAREYGIPAVMSAAGAMSLLHDGQRVRVDGTRGTISAIDDLPAPNS